VAIEFKCPCGAVCRADEAKAGELFHCEVCGLDLPVPASGEAAPLAEVVGEPPAEGKAAVSSAAAEEFRAAKSADRTGFNEMMQQLHGIKAPAPAASGTSPAAPAAGSGAAGSGPAGSLPAGPAVSGLSASGSAAKAAAMAAGMRTREPAKPAAPVSRAAHHFGFKRLMWKPTFVVAGLCVLASGYAFTLFVMASGSGANVTPPDVVIKEPEVVKDAQGNLWAIPRGNTPLPRDDGTMRSKDAQGNEQAALKIVRDERGRAWAVPAGKTISVSKSGKVFYQDDSGFDVSPESADRWLYVQDQLDQHSGRIKAEKAGRQHGSLWFGIGLLVVGLVLAGFGVWMRIDVKQVLRERAAEAEKEGPAAPGAGSPASGKK